MGMLGEANKIAVIDTETSYSDKVISIGLVAVDAKTFEVLDGLYTIVSPECDEPAMYSDELDEAECDFKGDRKSCIKLVKEFLVKYNLKHIFAYNASFDCNHLPELSDYSWYDIMKIAPYVQYNPSISGKDLYKTGRLKTGYGVEKILQGLYKYHKIKEKFYETHNAVLDAVDETKIMELLGHDISVYEKAKICIPKPPVMIKTTQQVYIEMPDPEEETFESITLRKKYVVHDLKNKNGDVRCYDLMIEFTKTLVVNRYQYYCGTLFGTGLKVPIYAIVTDRSTKGADLLLFKNIVSGEIDLNKVAFAEAVIKNKEHK